MDLGRYDAGDLLLLSLFELVGFGAGFELIKVASRTEGAGFLVLLGWMLVLAHGSVLVGQTWYPGLLRFATTMALPFCLASLLALPGLDVGWRTAILTFFGVVVLTYWVSGRIFELGYETLTTFQTEETARAR